MRLKQTYDLLLNQELTGTSLSGLERLISRTPDWGDRQAVVFGHLPLIWTFILIASLVSFVINNDDKKALYGCIFTIGALMHIALETLADATNAMFFADNRTSALSWIPTLAKLLFMRTIPNTPIIYELLLLLWIILLANKSSRLKEENRSLASIAENLTESEQTFRTISEAAQDAVLVVNQEGSISYRNTAAEAMFGFREEDNRQQLFRDMIMPESVAFEFICPCREIDLCTKNNGYRKVFRAEAITAEGTTLPVELSKGCIRRFDRHYTVFIARDITLRLMQEESIRRYNDMQAEFESQIEKKLLQSIGTNMLKGAEINQFMLSSGHLGGDFTDCVYYDGHHADILIGDVMGHGIQSALIGAGVKALFLKTIAQLKTRSCGLPDLQEIMSEVQRRCVQEMAELGTFVTLVVVRLDLRSGTMEFIDCGHTPIIHYQAAIRSCVLLKGNHLPLGITEQEEYTSVIQPVDDDDIIVLYSDGITDNDASGTWGVERLTRLVRESIGQEPHMLLDKIRQCCDDTAEGTALSDDATCITIHVRHARTESQDYDCNRRKSQSTAP